MRFVLIVLNPAKIPIGSREELTACAWSSVFDLILMTESHICGGASPNYTWSSRMYVRNSCLSSGR